MLRVGLLFMFVVAATAPVMGQSVSPRIDAAASDGDTRQSRQRIDLSAFEARRAFSYSRANDETASLPAGGDRWAQSISIPGVSFGMAESDSGSRIAKARRFAIVRLDGVTLFGGSVGGSVDGRSAHLVLTWRTGQ